MSDQAAQEPTMEEILASIRRIISEDDAPASDAPAPAPDPEPAAELLAEPAPEAPAAADDDDDILDLTQPMDEPETFAPAPAPRAAAPSFSETMGDLEAYIAAPAITAAPAPTPVAAPQPASYDDGGLLSSRTAASVSSAFGQLSSAMAMPAPGRTLEDVVRELLRPLLKDWLDQNLGRIVEAKVAEEVERVSRAHR